MSFAHVDLEGIVILVFTIHSGSYTLYPPGLGSMSCEGRNLMETSHLGLSVPTPLIL